MKKDVFPSVLNGRVAAPGSKSIAQRLAAVALLSEGESIIHHYPESDDCVVAMEVVKALGAVVEKSGNRTSIKGGFPFNDSSRIRNPKSILHCGESGLASRMFTPIASLYSEQITIQGSGSLITRPFTEYDRVLPLLGAQCQTTNGLLPLIVDGPLRGGKVELDGSLSSQFLTGLLLALPLAQNDSELIVLNLKSKPYVQMTLEIMAKSGIEVRNENFQRFCIKGNQRYRSLDMEVPGDWSGAAFLLVAGALCAENGITIENLNRDITQADSRILEALTLAGVSFQIQKNEVTVHQSEIKWFDFDATECPDLMPPLVALAAFADGVSTIKGAKRLVHKESNRAKALMEEFAKSSVRVVMRDDELKVYPSPVRKAILNSHNDHRIAMAAAMLGLAGDRTTVAGAECVAKSFPDYFEKLIELGAHIR
ncbi:MAG: 3-phosphoshikimate 1-carboxyvinyltransferase [Flavobacteriales bacterium]